MCGREGVASRVCVGGRELHPECVGGRELRPECVWEGGSCIHRVCGREGVASTECVGGRELLSAGSTPLGMYRKLVEFYKEDKLSFKYVKTFNMDEYVGTREKWRKPTKLSLSLSPPLLQVSLTIIRRATTRTCGRTSSST